MIIELDDMRPHIIQEVICLKCFKRWLAVFPNGTLLKELECPKCYRCGYVIGTGQEIVENEENSEG